MYIESPQNNHGEKSLANYEIENTEIDKTNLLLRA